MDGEEEEEGEEDRKKKKKKASVRRSCCCRSSRCWSNTSEESFDLPGAFVWDECQKGDI